MNKSRELRLCFASLPQSLGYYNIKTWVIVLVINELFLLFFATCFGEVLQSRLIPI
jgi:hypothetical protein